MAACDICIAGRLPVCRSKIIIDVFRAYLGVFVTLHILICLPYRVEGMTNSKASPSHHVKWFICWTTSGKERRATHTLITCLPYVPGEDVLIPIPREEKCAMLAAMGLIYALGRQPFNRCDNPPKKRPKSAVSSRLHLDYLMDLEGH